MADFPGGIYSPRTKENKAGISYSASETEIGYAEDVTKLDDEVVAIETFLAPKLLTLRPEINISEINKRTVPVQTQRGVFFGYILPVYDTDYQEIYISQRVPYRWDESSDIRVQVRIMLAAGEDVGDKFNLQLAWENAVCGNIVPDSVNLVPVETTLLADRNDAFDEYCITFTIDYDIDGEGNEIKAGSFLAMRLRRLAASSLEITDNIILLDFLIEYQRDKFGGAF